jgi:hypothetical protein
LSLVAVVVAVVEHILVTIGYQLVEVAVLAVC